MNATGDGGSPTLKESSITHSVAFGLTLPLSGVGVLYFVKGLYSYLQLSTTEKY